MFANQNFPTGFNAGVKSQILKNRSKVLGADTVRQIVTLLLGALLC
jgi:hypothetical protein